MNWAGNQSPSPSPNPRPGPDPGPPPPPEPPPTRGLGSPPGRGHSHIIQHKTPSRACPGTSPTTRATANQRRRIKSGAGSLSHQPTQIPVPGLNRDLPHHPRHRHPEAPDQVRGGVSLKSTNTKNPVPGLPRDLPRRHQPETPHHLRGRATLYTSAPLTMIRPRNLPKFVCTAVCTARLHWLSAQPARRKPLSNKQN